MGEAVNRGLGDYCPSPIGTPRRPQIDRRAIFEYQGNQYDTLTELIDSESAELDLSVKVGREAMRDLLDAIDAYQE